MRAEPTAASLPCLTHPFGASLCQHQRVCHCTTNTLRWPYNQDHSKWGVTASLAGSAGGSGCSGSSGSSSSSSSSTAFTCIGDLNRDSAQARRGGGYVCTSAPGLHTAMSSLVASVEQCGSQQQWNSRSPHAGGDV
jgi:hypothetical protein